MPSSFLDTDAKYDTLVKLFDDELKQRDADYQMRNKNQEHRRFESVCDALEWLTPTNDSVKVNVLITGSLYLCGLALKALDFKIN